MADKTYGPAWARRVFCALFGHSNIVENCLYEIFCVRCGAKIGDSLTGVWMNTKAVVFGHNCEKCAENVKKLTWKDRTFIRKPLTGAIITAEEAKKRERETMDKALDVLNKFKVERQADLKAFETGMFLR